jgi:hypothetical protein
MHIEENSNSMNLSIPLIETVNKNNHWDRSDNGISPFFGLFLFTGKKVLLDNAVHF